MNGLPPLPLSLCISQREDKQSILNYFHKITNLHCSACFTSQLSENKHDMIARVYVPTTMQIRTVRQNRNAWPLQSSADTWVWDSLSPLEFTPLYAIIRRVSEVRQSIATITGHSAGTSMITSTAWGRTLIWVLKDRLSPTLFCCLKKTILHVLKEHQAGSYCRGPRNLG